MNTTFLDKPSEFIFNYDIINELILTKENDLQLKEKNKKNLYKTARTALMTATLITTSGSHDVMQLLTHRQVKDESIIKFQASEKLVSDNNPYIVIKSDEYNNNYQATRILSLSQGAGLTMEEEKKSENMLISDWSYVPSSKKSFELPDTIILKKEDTTFQIGDSNFIKDEIVYEAKSRRSIEL
jgi:hypothetical protein